MGPKKGKGKGSKLARMTDEERARYLQHRAAIEEEARRRKQQLISTFMKNQLRKEEAFTRLNLAKINQQWRQILRRISTQQLRQQLQYLWQSFDHLLERKQWMVDSLLAGLQDAEEQYSKAWRYHAEMIDRLLTLQGRRLWTLVLDYESERRELQYRAGLLSRHLQADSAVSEHALKVVTHMLSCRAAGGHLDHETRMNDVVHTAVSALECLQCAGRARVLGLWRQLQQVLGDYGLVTEPRMGAYCRLRERDAQSACVIAQQRKRVEQLGHQRRARTALLLSGRAEKQKESLEAQRDSLEQLLWSLRRGLEVSRHHDEQHITFMTATSNQVIKKLQLLVGKSEQLLVVAALCGKKETQQEKVMPFKVWSQPQSSPPEQDETSAATLQVDGLWQRYNQAYLQWRALCLHQQALCLERNQLVQQVRQYLGAARDQPPLQPATRPCTTSQRRQQLVAVLPSH